MTYDDLPVIRLMPGPTDAELEAERDAKHEAELRQWFGRRALAEGWSSGAVFFAGAVHGCHCGHPAAEHDAAKGRCEAQVFGPYGPTLCTCPAYEYEGES